MFSQPPFPRPLTPDRVVPKSGERRRLDVVVPTRDRPRRLKRCLGALAAAREQADFRVLVCDSSSGPAADRVAELCAEHAFASLVRHDRVGAAAARNVGTYASDAELVVAVDDDVYVAPDAIARLLEHHGSLGSGLWVVAGSVTWSHWTSQPLVMRLIGHGRDAKPGEEIEFLVSALVLYPRALAVACPWNERLWPYDDRFVTLLWRVAGATLEFTDEARAVHDEQHTSYPVDREADRIYGNLFDALFVTHSIRRFLGFEFLGFAACTKRWMRTPRALPGLVWAWVRGQAAFVRDLPRLRQAVHAARHYRSHKEGR